MTEQVFLYLPGRKKEKMHRFCKSKKTPASLEEVCLSAFILGVALGFFPPHSAWFGHSRHVFVNTQCFLPDWTLHALNPTPRTLLLNSSLSPPPLSFCVPEFLPSAHLFSGVPLCMPLSSGVYCVWWCLSPHRSLFCDRLNYGHYIFCLKVISNTLLLLLFILFLNSVHSTALPDIVFAESLKSTAYNWFTDFLVNKVLDEILQGRNLAPLAKHKSYIKESSWVHM